MSQSALAQWLGISRGMVAKAERNACTLSTAALLKLAQLQRCLFDASHGQEKRRLLNFSETNTADHLKADETRIKECRYQVAMLQRKLERLDAAYTKHTQLYTVLEALEAKVPAQETWMQQHKDKLTKKLPTCGETARRELEKKIYLLTAEVDYINRFPGNYPTMKTNI